MRRRRIVLMAAILFCWPSAAGADIVQPSPAPSALADREDLALQRADLMAQWEALQQAIAAHNAQCSEVLEDSPQVESCQASQAAILSDVETYKEGLQEYEDTLLKALPPPSPDPDSATEPPVPSASDR